MAFHLAGGKPGPVAKAGTAARGRARDPGRYRDITSLRRRQRPGPPGYAPIPRSAPGPQSVTGRAASPGATVGGGDRRLGLALLVIATAQLMVVLDRNRAGSYLIILCVATGLFGLFFFLTLFIQNVLGYSAIRSGVAYLPFAVGVVIASALASPLVARIGPRPLILAGSAMVAGGMFWFSRLTEHASYAGHLLGPMLVSSFGLGLVFVPLSLVSLHNVAEQDSGIASSLLNAGQQIGGAVGLALLGTVAWTTVANSVRTQVAHAAAAAAKAGQPLPKPGTPACVHLRSRPDGRLFPCVRCCRGDRAARPARRDRHHPGQPPGTGRCCARAARGGTAARSIAGRDRAAA